MTSRVAFPIDERHVLFMILLDNNIKFEEVQINEYLTPLNSIRINSRVGNLEVIENLKYCIGVIKIQIR